MEIVSYWLTDKQSMPYHVSLFQVMSFSTGFPITINKPQLSFSWKSLNDKQTMHFVFAIKTKHKSVSRGNSKIIRKEMSRLFSCNYLTICRNVTRWDAKEAWVEKRGIKKKMMNFYYCEEYLISISNKISIWQR